MVWKRWRSDSDSGKIQLLYIYSILLLNGQTDTICLFWITRGDCLDDAVVSVRVMDILCSAVSTKISSLDGGCELFVTDQIHAR